MKIQISTTVTPDEKDEIDSFCRAHDIKVAQLIRWALRDYMNKDNKSEE